MRDLKRAASIHMAEHRPHFSWQEGYAAFTVSATSRESVKRYIDRQEEHHRVKGFREELVEMLKQASVEYEDRYLD